MAGLGQGRSRRLSDKCRLLMTNTSISFPPHTHLLNISGVCSSSHPQSSCLPCPSPSLQAPLSPCDLLPGACQALRLWVRRPRRVQWGQLQPGRDVWRTRRHRILLGSLAWRQDSDGQLQGWRLRLRGGCHLPRTSTLPRAQATNLFKTSCSCLSWLKKTPDTPP